MVFQKSKNKQINLKELSENNLINDKKKLLKKDLKNSQL